MPSLPYEALIPLLFPVVFAGFWCVVLFLLGSMSGWRGLAERFATDDGAPDGVLRFQSGRLNGLVNYNNILTVGVSPSGLYLATFLLFRPGHRPLLIPWSKVTDQGPRKVWFQTMQLIEVDGVALQLRAKTWERVSRSPYARSIRAAHEG